MTIISVIKVPVWIKLKRDAQLVFCTRGTAGVEVGYEHAAVAHKLIPPYTTVALVLFKNGVRSGCGCRYRSGEDTNADGKLVLVVHSIHQPFFIPEQPVISNA